MSQRELNRATLARQLLLWRVPMPADQAIEHLVGLQAQAPRAPYVGLWTRLVDFDPDELSTLVSQRQAVRATLMRTTIHLMTARDALAVRALLQPAIERSFAASPFAKNLAGIDLAALRAAGRGLFAPKSRTRAELSTLLARQWPDRDSPSLAYALTYLLALVQVPPRGLWHSNGVASWSTVEEWLGTGLPDPEPADALMRRYLAAYGPASVKDAQVWSGLTRLAEVFDRLRPGLVVLRDEQGTELFDLPDAPRPGADVPAPVRFLPEYDNLLLSHANRSRVIVDGRRVPLPPGNGGAIGTVLVDGMLSGVWRITRQAGAAILTVDPYARLARSARPGLIAEANRLLDFAWPADRHEVVLNPPS